MSECICGSLPKKYRHFPFSLSICTNMCGVEHSYRWIASFDNSYACTSIEYPLAFCILMNESVLFFGCFNWFRFFVWLWCLAQTKLKSEFLLFNNLYVCMWYSFEFIHVFFANISCITFCLLNSSVFPLFLLQ